MIKYILFDLDGTLTNSGEGICKCLARAFKDCTGEVIELEEFVKYIGPPLSKSLKDFTDYSDEKAKEIIERYRVVYDDTGWKQNHVYDGVEQMLSKLKQNGKVLLVATSKPLPSALMVIEYFGLDKYFDFICGSDLEKGGRVTKGDVVKYALENIKDKYGEFSLDEVVMVGDRLFDIEGARENGVETIGVTYGFGDYEELEKYGAKCIVNTPKEVVEYIG